MTDEEAHCDSLVLPREPLEEKTMGSSSQIVVKEKSPSDSVILNPSNVILQKEKEETAEDILNYQNASICIEHSTDVIIGPVTQYHGPVTILQNVNGGIENGSYEKGVIVENGLGGKNNVRSYSECNSPPDLVTGDTTSKNLRKTCPVLLPLPPHQTKMLAIGLILLVIFSAIIAVAVHYSKESNDEEEENKTFFNDSSDTRDDLFVSREKWGGRPPKYTIKLQHPTPIVIISHTAGSFCRNTAECSNIVRSAQSYHVAQIGTSDVGYNFMLGGDNKIYVGRGWDNRNFHRENSIGICFIGNYVFDELTPAMIENAKKLLEIGVESGKLSKDYKLVCHNQTFATESPGQNVYKVVKQWPHFTPQKLN